MLLGARCKIILTFCTFDFDFFSHQNVTTAKRIIQLFNFSNCARQDYDICIFRLRDWAFKLAREDSASRIQFFSSRSSVTESANLNPEWILNKTFEFEYLRLNHPFGDNANFGFQSDQLTRKIVHFFFSSIYLMHALQLQSPTFLSVVFVQIEFRVRDRLALKRN